MPLNLATENFFKKIRGMFQQNPPKPLEAMDIHEYRQAGVMLFSPLAGEPANISSKNLEINDGSGNNIPVTIFNTDAPGYLPALIFFPGGGFIASQDVHHVPCSRIAEKARCRVILVNTRLAPENKFPAGLNDAFNAYKWIFNHASSLEIDPNKIMVGGDSSGGNFAALVAIKARDEHLRLAHQFLISPATDLSRSIKTYIAFEQHDMLITPELITWAYRHYLPIGIGANDPKVSPYWNQELGNLAPATIIVAEYDGLRSDSDAYAEKLATAGTKCELVICEGQVHSFLVARKELYEGIDPVDIISQKIIRLFPPS